MKKTISLVVPVLLALSVTLVVAQERVKKKSPDDFKQTYAALGQAWDAGNYGLAMKTARELIGMITVKRVQAILAAMPAPPEGYEKVDNKRAQNAAANQAIAGLTAAVGSTIEQQYRPVDGGGSTLQIVVTADSPMIQMVQMWLTNPALLGEDAELIQYGPYQAVLRKLGSGYSLQLVLGQDICEIQAPGMDDESLLAWITQAVVDALAKALGH